VNRLCDRPRSHSSPTTSDDDAAGVEGAGRGDEVIIVDPTAKTIVWQYGQTDVPRLGRFVNDAGLTRPRVAGAEEEAAEDALSSGGGQPRRKDSVVRRTQRGALEVANSSGRGGNGGLAPLNETAGSPGAGKPARPVEDGYLFPGPVEPARGRVVLSVGSGYFHDGKVTADRYAKDLAPAYLAAIAGAHTLLGAIFAEHGAAASMITSRCERWEVRFGPGEGQVELVELADGVGDHGTPGVADRRVGPWLRGVAADREGDHAGALGAFAKEAEDAVAAGVPQRAAVAYRSAAMAARQAGRSDEANRLLRLAGKAYLEIAELPETIDQGVFMAYREAARCLLDAGNLPLAHATLTKALAIGRALGYVDDA